MLAAHLSPIADAGHLAAAEDGAIDFRTAADVDLGVGHTACQNVVVSLGVALTRAEDVAHALVAARQQIVAIVGIVANRATRDIDGGQAMVNGIINMFRHIGITKHVHARKGHTAAAEDGTPNLAVFHGDGGIA